MSDQHFRDILVRYPATRHLAAKLAAFDVEMSTGVESCIEASVTIEIMESFIAIAESEGNAEMLEIAANMRRLLPTIRAFDADPINVMERGVN